MDTLNNNQQNNNTPLQTQAQPDINPVINSSAPAPKINKNIVLLILIIVLAVALGAAVFFIQNNNNQKKLISNENWKSSTVQNNIPNSKLSPTVTVTTSAEEQEVDSIVVEDNTNADFQQIDNDLKQLQ